MEDKTLSELIEKMKEQRYSQRRMAKELGMSASALNGKLHLKTSFKLDEAGKMCDLLEIPYSKIPQYFFIR